MNKVREHISLIQSQAGYNEEFLWEAIYDGLKPKLKEMWATIVSPPEGLQEKYATLVKLGAVAEDNKVEQKKGSSTVGSEEKEGEEKDKKKKQRKRKRKRKSSEESKSSERKAKEPRVPK